MHWRAEEFSYGLIRLARGRRGLAKAAPRRILRASGAFFVALTSRPQESSGPTTTPTFPPLPAICPFLRPQPHHPTEKGSSLNRRQWLCGSAAAAAASTLAFPTLVSRDTLAAPGRPGANDRIRLGFIGLRGRARWILTSEGLPGAEVAAVADCYLPRCHEAAKVVPGGEKWKKYQHYREMLEQEKLDAVFVETTTHARVLACIHVLQAGCDVYAEKPLTLTIAEGRILAHAV